MGSIANGWRNIADRLREIDAVAHLVARTDALTARSQRWSLVAIVPE
jgi:hypothetical protein